MKKAVLSLALASAAALSVVACSKDVPTSPSASPTFSGKLPSYDIGVASESQLQVCLLGPNSATYTLDASNVSGLYGNEILNIGAAQAITPGNCIIVIEKTSENDVPLNSGIYPPATAIPSISANVAGTWTFECTSPEAVFCPNPASGSGNSATLLANFFHGSTVTFTFTPSSSCPIDNTPLDGAGIYAVFGLNGTEINLHNVKVNGDVAVAMNGKLGIGGPSTVTGNVYLGTGVTLNKSGKVNGTIFTNQNLAGPDAAAVATASALGALAPNYTLASLTSSQTFNSAGATTVINVGDVNLASGAKISFSGGGLFVLNVTGNFKMGGNAQIGNPGDENKVIINIIGTGNTAKTQVGNSMYGTLLSVDRSLELDGKFYGRVITGGSLGKLMSGALVTYVPCT